MDLEPLRKEIRRRNLMYEWHKYAVARGIESPRSYADKKALAAKLQYEKLMSMTTSNESTRYAISAWAAKKALDAPPVKPKLPTRRPIRSRQHAPQPKNKVELTFHKAGKKYTKRAPTVLGKTQPKSYLRYADEGIGGTREENQQLRRNLNSDMRERGKDSV